jgi:galactose mutarotase-like enzyme
MSFSPKHGGLGTSLIITDNNVEHELLYFPKGFELESYHKVCGGWPFIFPICGRLSRADSEGRYLYNGKTYAMPIHGFAHRLAWEVLEHRRNALTMRAQESELTMQEYPFCFELILEYEISENKLSCKQTYKNTGVEALPYYAGFHPYFALNAPKDQVMLHYYPKRRLQYNQKLNDVIGELPLFKTPAALTLPELNESLVELSENKWVSLSFPDHSQINMQAKGVNDPDLFPYIQLYHIASEAFICIEPWMSHPNSMNTVRGARWLAPNTSEQGILNFEFMAPG